MRILTAFGALLVLIATPALAKNGTTAWILTQKSGDVRVLRNGVQPASVQIRAALLAGDVIATGANGRAMLTRGDDYVVVAPGSRLILPKEEQRSGFTRLIQQVGTMLYKVRRTGVPHFAVETPMLAAVVKGTSFTVVVDKDRAAVQVTEGVVEVSPATGHARRLVERGMTVYVGRERPHEIIEMKPGAVEPPSFGGGDGETVRIESSGDVPLSTITDLTGGLVREAPAAPVVAVADVSTPVVTTPAAVTPAAATPAVTAAVTTPAVATPAIVTPAVATPGVAAPAVVIPAVATPGVTAPTVVIPAVATPAVTTPAVTTPVVTTPVVTVPAVTVPAVTVPTVTVPTPIAAPPIVVATPTVTIPTVTTPTITTPTITTPVIATPIITVPTVTVPTVTVPAVTLPPVTLPSIGLGIGKGPPKGP